MLGAALQPVFFLWSCVPLLAQAQVNPRDFITANFLTFPLHDGLDSGGAVADEPFTIFFVADSEPRMRGNTNEEVAQYINNLVSYKTSRSENFTVYSQYRIDPQLVILEGDISADRQTSIVADAPLWQILEENGIAFIAGVGNHDWTPESQYSADGDSWNREALAFCRDTYRNATRVGTPWFSYKEFGPTDNRGPVTSLARFRGVYIANFNSFLYQPSYRYDFESASGQDCAQNRLAQGWAGCQHFTSAENQIAAMEAALTPVAGAGSPVLFTQHYPTTTSDSWWDDYEASGSTVSQKKGRLGRMITRHGENTYLFTGHMHEFDQHNVTVPGGGSNGVNTFKEAVAPYFGGAGGSDLNQGGGFLAILVSPTQGVLEVKPIMVPLYDAARTTAVTTPQPSTMPETTTAGAVDMSVLGSRTSSAGIEACITSNCIAEAVACAGDSSCLQVSQPLLAVNSNGGATLEVFAELLMAFRNLAPNSAATMAVSKCVDTNCGTAIIPGTTTTAGNTTAEPGATTWNPWVATPMSGCLGHALVVPILAVATVGVLSVHL